MGFTAAKVWHSTDKYRRVIWQCNGKFKGKEKCDTPHLTEEAIQQKFLAAFNELLKNRDFIIKDTKELMARLTDASRLEEEASRLRNEMAGISQSVRALIDRNARSGVEQGEYEREYQAMTERFAELEKRLKDIEAECDRRKITAQCLDRLSENTEIYKSAHRRFHAPALERAGGKGHCKRRWQHDIYL